MFGCISKNFRKIFSDVWLCSWKYHRKHIFYLLLTFSQLPNKHIMSFIPKITNKSQKRSHFLGEITIAIAISIGEIAIAISPILIARSRSHDASIAIAIDAYRRGSSDHDRNRWWSFSLSRAECVLFAWVFSFCGSLSLLRFFRKSFEVKQQCKMISGSTM